MTTRRDCIQALVTATAAAAFVAGSPAEAAAQAAPDAEPDNKPGNRTRQFVVITIAVPDNGFLSPLKTMGKMTPMDGVPLEGLTHMPPGDSTPPPSGTEGFVPKGSVVRHIDLSAELPSLNPDNAWLIIKKCGAVNALLGQVQSHCVNLLKKGMNDTPIEKDERM